VARLVGFCYVIPSAGGDIRAEGHVEPVAVLRPGTGVTIITDVSRFDSPDEPLRGVTTCIDSDETTYGWDLRTSRRKKWRRHWWHEGNKATAEVFKAFYKSEDPSKLPESSVTFQSYSP
jgi:hypothetical protein